MSTRHLNQTKFAEELGVSRQAVNKAIRGGLLVKHGSGRGAYIDMDCPLTRAYKKSGSSNRHRSKSTKPHSKPKAKSSKKHKKKSTSKLDGVDKSAEPSTGKPEETSPEPSGNEEAVDAYASKQEVERIKKLKEIDKLDLHNKTTRGQLIPRELVQLFINSMYEIDNGQWRTLGLKIAADIAAALGIDDDEMIRKIADLVDKEALSILKQIKREQKKFLKSIGAKKLDDNKTKN